MNNFKYSHGLQLAMIKTYLFDLDDTLIDTKIYAQLYPKILLLIENKKKLKGLGLDKAAESFGLKKNKYGRWDTGDLYRRQEISEYNPCLRIYKGTNNKFEYLVPLVYVKN